MQIENLAHDHDQSDIVFVWLDMRLILQFPT